MHPRSPFFNLDADSLTGTDYRFFLFNARTECGKRGFSTWYPISQKPLPPPNFAHLCGQRGFGTWYLYIPSLFFNCCLKIIDFCFLGISSPFDACNSLINIGNILLVCPYQTSSIMNTACPHIITK